MLEHLGEVVNTSGDVGEGVPAGHDELVAADCWSCGVSVHKRVRRQLRGLGPIAWFCRGCDVTWSGPGVPLGRPA